MPVEVIVPANFVATGWGTPNVCVRHGEPAVDRRSVQFVSHVSGWLRLLGVIVYHIVLMATRKTVVSPTWPYCARCEKEYTTRKAVGVAGLAVGAVLWFAGLKLPDGLAAIGTLVGTVLFIAGAVFLGRANRVAIAGGVVTDDGLAVRFAKAHEAFASQAAAAQQAAAQHYAAQHYAAQQYYPAQPYAAQPYAAQPYPGQPYAAQPAFGQPYPAQPVPGPSYPAQPAPGQPYPAPSVPGQSYPAPLVSGPAYPAQPVPGQPYPAQPALGQSDPAQPGLGQPTADAYPTEQPPAAV